MSIAATSSSSATSSPSISGRSIRSANGLYNVGTGGSRSFNDLAKAVVAARGTGRIEYVPMPADLAGAYQAFTEADISRLRTDGFEAPFVTIEDGVRQTLATT